MSCENTKVAVSVADALLFDTSCGGEQLILNAKTLMNSSISIAVQENLVYGGKGSKTLASINYQKELTVTLEDAAFSPVYLAAGSGTNIAQKLGKFYTNATVTLDADGVGTLPSTPTGNVQVEANDSQFMTVIPVADKITVASLAGKEVRVVYAEEGTYDTITIEADKFAKGLKLVLNVDIYDNGGLVEQMQITIPNFKPDGNMELSFTHDGVSTSSLSGRAIADCGGAYAEIAFKDVAQEGGACYSSIYADPNEVELDSTVVGDSVTVAIRGVREGIYGNITIPNADLTWAVDDDTIATVVDGVITLATTATLGDTATVTVTNNSTPPLTDTITVTVV